MASPISISNAEWEVMNVLWTVSPKSAAQVIDALHHKNWNPRTIKTLLARLVKKGVLSHSKQGKMYLYQARLSRDACVQAKSKSFLTRIFAGAAGPMLVQFVREASLSPADIEELQKALIDKAQQDRK